ncbi:MAG: hypothetical protein JNK81_07645 [Anaerolineales bacterium]|nr:hypothetical protein [Anaerolineales bacterium]
MFKNFQFNLKTLLFLIIGGLFLGFYGGNILEIMFDAYPSSFTIFNSFLSSIFLLILCWVGIKIILWAYIKSGLLYSSKVIVIMSLLITVFVLVSRIWLLAKQQEYLLSVLEKYLEEYNLGNQIHINYFALNFWMVFLTHGAIVSIFLWLGYWRKKKEGVELSSKASKLKLFVLIIFTFFIFGMILLNALESINFILFLQSIEKEQLKTHQAIQIYDYIFFYNDKYNYSYL